jgi:molybdopterin molybdotransferase
MITVHEAEEIIQSISMPTSVEHVPIENAHGHVLAESIYADSDLPPFDRAMMDGIAVRLYSNDDQKEFNIIGIQRAGLPQNFDATSNSCIEIMTGAAVPEGFNTVIPYEHLLIQGHLAVVQVAPSIGQNIQYKGSDFKQGALLISTDKKLRSPEIGILASVGKTNALVKKRPRVAVISTGDELATIDQTPGPGQIRRSNVYAVSSVLRQLGLEVATFHLNDDADEIRTGLQIIFEKFDWIILSGGVSMGKYDLIPQIMSELKVKQLFHKIAQRPGKPFWCGQTETGKPVFALPGNPVSTLMCMHRYVVPFTQEKVMGGRIEWTIVTLDQDYVKKGTLTQFVPVQCQLNNVIVVKTSGSGDFAHLQQADGWIEIPAEMNDIKKGQTFRFIPFL